MKHSISKFVLEWFSSGVCRLRYIVHLVILLAPLGESHRLTYLWLCAHGVSIGGITSVCALPAVEHLFAIEIVSGKLEVSVAACCMIPWYQTLERGEGHYVKIADDCSVFKYVRYDIHFLVYSHLGHSFVSAPVPSFHRYDLFRLNNYHFWRISKLSGPIPVSISMLRYTTNYLLGLTSVPDYNSKYDTTN